MGYLFGMRCCILCPDCACTDLFGSNVKLERRCSWPRRCCVWKHRSTENDGLASRSFSFFVECLHQHTPLQTLLTEYRKELKTLFSQYAKYKALVCRQVYEDLEAWTKRQSTTESEWKEQYGTSFELIDTPTYLSKITSCIGVQGSQSESLSQSLKARRVKTGRAWLRDFLKNVQRRQDKWQNHLHVWNENKKSKMPLEHCQCPDDPTKCKGGFPE